MSDHMHYIKNIEGTLYSFDVPLCEFSIKDRELVYFKDLSNKKFYPFELALGGATYGSFNNFFNRRVVKDYAMFIREYLNDMGLDSYDIDELVKRNNGSCHDTYWIKFKDFGVKSWDELQHTRMPIYK